MLKHSHRHRPHPRSPSHPCLPPSSPKNKGLPTGFKTDKEAKFWNEFMVFKAKIVCDLQSTDHAKYEKMDSFMVRKIEQKYQNHEEICSIFHFYVRIRTRFEIIDTVKSTKITGVHISLVLL